MSQQDSRPPKENRPRNNPNDPNFNWRGIMLFAIAIALIGGAVLFKTPYGNVKEIPTNVFDEYLETGLISKDRPLDLVVESASPTQWLKGSYMQKKNGAETAVPFKTSVSLDYDKDLKDRLKEAGLKVNTKSESNLLASALIGFLPIALFLLVLYFFFRQQIRMAGKGA